MMYVTLHYACVQFIYALARCPVTCVVGEETDRGQHPPSLSNISNVTKLVQTNTLKLNTLLTRYNIAQAQNVVW